MKHLLCCGVVCCLICNIQDSTYYDNFRMFSCEAYNILRKSADLILSLFHLMAGASIEAIRYNPENAMLKLQVRNSQQQAVMPGNALAGASRGFITQTATTSMPVARQHVFGMRQLLCLPSTFKH
jgi:hypothetical protein